jgi:AraC family ethanolamine operon transcriptional activator
VQATGIANLHGSGTIGGEEPQVVSRVMRGFDPDQLSDSFRPGDVEHRLLESGTFEARLLGVTTTKLGLQVFRYSRPVALNGAWPANRTAIVFGFELPEGAVVQGQPFPTGAIIVLDRATAIEARLPAHATCAVLIVERKLLQSAMTAGDPEMWCAGTMAGIPLSVREPDARRLKGLLRAVLDDAELAGQLLQTPEFSVLLERNVLKAYVSALAGVQRPRCKGHSVLDRRNRLVKKAESYVIEHLDQSIHIGELCREVGASPRALEYAFQGVYRMGAMRYLRTIRLNEVRKTLLRSSDAKAATVTSAAMEWGFWHLGEFAAAYRRLFGEAPSETLRLAAARKPLRERHSADEYGEPREARHTWPAPPRKNQVGAAPGTLPVAAYSPDR